MSATSRALAALTLSAAVLLPAQAAVGLPGEDPAPAVTGSTEVKTPSGKTATIQMAATDGAVAAPPVAADSWVLADLDSGQILASLNADLAVRPASTLKLLTALTVAPRLAPEQPYRAVAADEDAEGNRVVLYKGLTYTVADLMNAALMPSANDAAEALARANGGVKVTVEQMNAEAARLGATRTTVKNPSGLDADGQVTTAYDMALIGRAALANREVADSLLRRQVDFPGKMEKGKRVIYPVYNHNRTVVNKRLEGYLGGKSGYTSKAGNTMVAGAEKDGRRLLVTLFHIGGNTYRASETLLKWGFANADKLQPRRHARRSLRAGSAVRPGRSCPLPEKGKTPVNREVAAGTAPAADAPTAPIQPRSLSLGLPGDPDARPALTADRPDPAGRGPGGPARPGLLDRPPQPDRVDEPGPVGHDPGALRRRRGPADRRVRAVGADVERRREPDRRLAVLTGHRSAPRRSRPPLNRGQPHGGTLAVGSHGPGAGTALRASPWSSVAGTLSVPASGPCRSLCAVPHLRSGDRSVGQRLLDLLVGDRVARLQRRDQEGAERGARRRSRRCTSTGC